MDNEFIGYSEALKRTLEHLVPLEAIELPLAESISHICAEEVLSLVDSPSGDASLKDGYAVCAELKADPEYSEIPILLLTAVVSHISETHYTPRMGMETEAEDYLDKPADPKEILSRIGNLVK